VSAISPSLEVGESCPTYRSKLYRQNYESWHKLGQSGVLWRQMKNAGDSDRDQIETMLLDTETYVTPMQKAKKRGKVHDSPLGL
jgi:hypothetical protein